MPPLVSILLPAWQAGATLQAALRSIERQTETRFECLVVDDGSTDATAAIARAAARRDGRIRWLRQRHRGLVAALEHGAAACRGRYVARMDADDVMHAERLAVQVGWLERAPRLAAVGCRVRLFPRAVVGDGMARYERWLNAMSPGALRRDAFVECPVAHPTLLLRRAVLERYGYRDVGWPEDYDLVLRLLAGGERLAVVPRRLHGWRATPGRLSRTDPRYGLDRFTACKAAFLATGLLRGRDRYVLWGHGPTGRALRAALERHGKRASHVVEVHPRRIGQTIRGAPVVPPAALGELFAAGADGARPRLVAAVAGAVARGIIRAQLDRLGLRELRDYVVAA